MIVRQAMVYVFWASEWADWPRSVLGVSCAACSMESEPHDPSTIALISVGLAGAAFLACCLPAAKAARVDPVVALRQE